MFKKRILNKWQWGAKINKQNQYDPRYTMGWHTFELWFLKFVYFPEEGEMIQKKHYKGFLLKFNFWFPIDKV